MSDNNLSRECRNAMELVLTHYRNEDWNGAEVFCQTFLSNYPDVAEGWFVLGMIAKQKGNQKLAEECLEQAFKLKENPIPRGFPA